MDSVSVRDACLRVKNMKTRIPFEYGIARLTALPHLFVWVQVECDGRREWGVASDGLAPKWFTKDPDQTFEQELAEMFDVIRTAVERLKDMNECLDLFSCWWKLYRRQMKWGREKGYPDLLTNFGVSLPERAAIDAFCRLRGEPFHHAIRTNSPNVDLGRIHDELSGSEPSDWLPDEPRETLTIRHTVGLSDPLTPSEISERNQNDDGLPHSLDENVQQYGIDHFKIKVPHDTDESRRRLRRIAGIVTKHLDSFAFSLDGNEAFQDLSRFREYWEYLREDKEVRTFLEDGLLFVEQPVHRQATNSSEEGKGVSDWHDRPPIVIDESDCSIEALPEALAQGYHGTSHKNCKGVFKGIANRCLIEKRNRENDGRPFMMSAEDLSTVGPVSLLQDLAVISLLGMDHAERNGHHYFPGLSMMSESIQRDVLEKHGSLYREHRVNGETFPSLHIEDGTIRLDDVNEAPFGYQIDLEPTLFTPITDWSFELPETTDTGASAPGGDAGKNVCFSDL